MTKTTIELHRLKDTTAGVGHMGLLFHQDSQSTLDALVEWTRQNSESKVYRHILFRVEENVRDEPHSWDRPEFVYPRKCDYVTYLDIYHQ